MILKMRVIPRIMWNQRKRPTQTKPTKVKEIVMTLGKDQQILQSIALKKHSNM